MAVNWRIANRKLHRWGAMIVAVPFLAVIVSGILLQLKKEFTWIQPATMKGTGSTPVISFDVILNTLKSVPDAAVTGWADVDRMDMQPKRGLAKVHMKNGWEVQIDLGTGAILQSAYRRSDMIESIHDGSFFHEAVKLSIFLPSAVIVLGLWCTGLYLLALPWRVKWKRKRANAINATTQSTLPTHTETKPRSGGVQ